MSIKEFEKIEIPIPEDDPEKDKIAKMWEMRDPDTGHVLGIKRRYKVPFPPPPPRKKSNTELIQEIAKQLGIPIE